MAPACTATFDLIKQGRLSHDGDDLFTAHVLAAGEIFRVGADARQGPVPRPHRRSGGDGDGGRSLERSAAPGEIHSQLLRREGFPMVLFTSALDGEGHSFCVAVHRPGRGPARQQGRWSSPIRGGASSSQRVDLRPPRTCQARSPNMILKSPRFVSARGDEHPVSQDARE